MRAFIVFSAFLAFTAVSAEKQESLPEVHGYKQGDECPAAVFKDRCNTCICMGNGRNAGCTKMACPDMKTRSVDIPIISDYKPGDDCPAKVWSDGCNTCVCTGGLVVAACTQKACLNVERAVSEDLPIIFNYEQGQACPAPVFIDNCNRCFCGPDGRSAACTKKGCGPKPEVVSGYTQGDECPAKVFAVDCNICYCDEDNHSAKCTDRTCKPLA